MSACFCQVLPMLSSTYVDVDFPDVHREYDGKCCGGAGNDTPG